MAIVFCIVNDIDSYSSEDIKRTITNIANFTIANIKTKGYEVLVGNNEDELLQLANRYDYAVVMSPGTEIINGVAFFEAIEELVKRDFFIAGHVLDRTMHNAYYELHHQCYVVNMAVYNAYKGPTVGSFQKDVQHTQLQPQRSTSNIHDDYTPHFVNTGFIEVTYKHKCHGWNLLKIAFENELPVVVFDDSIRNNKIHYYPESNDDYYKHCHLIQEKLDYCKNEFVHTDNTEWSTGINEKYEQVVLPASGTLYLDLIDAGRVVFYDYNQKALDYWKEACPRKEHIEYVFVYTNLLEEVLIVDHLDPKLKTLVNLSNIFCYEGTVAQYSLEDRIKAESLLEYCLKSKLKDVKINFTLKANALTQETQLPRLTL
jgi:hypothetical protein